jgi:hypothetical protein
MQIQILKSDVEGRLKGCVGSKKSLHRPNRSMMGCLFGISSMVFALGDGFYDEVLSILYSSLNSVGALWAIDFS